MREDDRSSPEARFETLYDRCYPKVDAYCRRRLAVERVDDAVAETFIVAWRRIDEVPDGSAGLMWLYRVAYRVVGHQWRSRDRQHQLHARLRVVPDEVVAAPDEAAVSHDEVERVMAAVARLNESDAEVLRLLCWEHLGRDEIAQVLDLAPNAVSQRIHRARRNLAKELSRLERRHGRRHERPADRVTEGGAS